MLKKIAIFFLILLFFAFSVPLAIKSYAQVRFRHFFKDAHVSIGSVTTALPPALIFSNVDIKNPSYEISVKRSMLNPDLKIIFEDPHIKINAIPKAWSRKNGTSNNDFLNHTFLRAIEIHNLDIDCTAFDFILKMHGSLDVDLLKRKIHSVDISASFIKTGDLSLENVIINIPKNSDGHLSIEKLTFNKLKIDNIQGRITAQNDSLRVEPLSASLVNGNLNGSCDIEIAHGFNYQASLDLLSLDMDKFTKDFELQKKMTANGLLTGKIKLSGDFSGLKSLSGDLSASEKGGDLVIQDQDFLNYLAQNVHQPIELVEAGFKEYHFDTAALSLAMEGHDINFLVNLNGQKGKRDFEIKLHDLL